VTELVMANVLNLGAGRKIIQGAVNHDREKYRPEIEVAHDLNLLPWPWEDNRFEHIIALAVLEHLPITLIQSMNECWRILRPGGDIHLKLPMWNSERSYDDPTHYWRFSPNALQVFDPKTKFGSSYSWYTPYKWRIIQKPWLNPTKTSIYAKLRVVKP